ncbi:LuxR C-terminal-related transcriptional regulator [Brevibacillus humidisoli]|uniref:LuxR C-terminal-related transcriptional regulator n=1 Tax=Brevibacillus humidisoli TaxID=2895522 RepID=UPI001E2BADAA|nr:LuxR C-terminal-related transcriptional regulator [Brevibacillus humidisoli]UFJ42029.1 LuxR C-terminal-related transcriptional regulator [Brevibacillus humidisoli]
MEKQHLIESVCANCPGTQWGSRSICSVFGKSVGYIEECEEWKRYPVKRASARAKDVSVSVTDQLRPALEWVQRTEEELRDYRFMVREIGRIEEYLGNVGQGLVSAYGIDGCQPKGKGLTANKTQNEVVHRERKWKRLMKLKETVDRIEQAAEEIADERERTVLDGLMDGEKNNYIARQLGVSRQRYYEIKRSLIGKMAWSMYGEQNESGD